MFRVNEHKYCGSRHLKDANLKSLQKGLRGQLECLRSSRQPSWRESQPQGLLWNTKDVSNSSIERRRG